MFESLTDRLQGVFQKLKNRGRLSEADVKTAMREIRLALLEADVSLKVVKDFIGKVSERAVGKDVLESLTPGQQVIKIVNDEMIKLLGATEAKLVVSPKPPTVVMLCGLQGSGKTTASAKLGHLLKRQGKNPMLVAADLQRPAAVEQLVALGQENDIPVYSGSGRSPKVAEAGLRQAVASGSDVVVVDTAGRLHIDEELMDELVEVREVIKPHEILLVVDSMTGQEAVNVAQAFHDRLSFDGVVLTKLDGDARGGAALSIRAVCGRPIKFASSGEKVDSLETFHPDRMASRILGMGDVMTLIEKAQDVADEKRAAEMEERLRRQEFTFDDFLEQMKQLRKMGPISQVLKMLPGAGSMKGMKDLKIGDEDFVRVQAIVESMTVEERNNPSVINGSRRRRIADGSGTSVSEVNQVLKQFAQTKKMIKAMMSGKKMGGMGLPFSR